jgi:hypothetical protein
MMGRGRCLNMSDEQEGGVSMRARVFTLLALCVLGAASLSPLAQEEQPDQPADEGAALEDPAAESSEAEAADEAEGGADGAAAGNGAGGDSRASDAAEGDEWEMPELPDDFLEDDVFIPTEEIAADEEVTFPVNI